MRTFPCRAIGWGACLAVVLAASSCGDSSSDTPAQEPGLDAGDASDASEPIDASAEVAPEAAVEAAVEAEAGPNPKLACDTLGLPSVPFQPGNDDPSLHALAADFTVPTTEGDWTLSQRWSGCDVYLLIQDTPKQNDTGFGYGIWDVPEDAVKLFARLPKNVHLLFMSKQTDATKRTAALDALKKNLDAAVAELAAEDQPWWKDRVHYVTAEARSLPGWIGEIMTSPGWGAAIDRAQRIRYIGSYADPYKFDDGEGWFGPNLSMVANEALYYNFEAARELRLALQNATIVTAWKQQTIAGASPYVEVSLPDAAQLAKFDTLELDMTMGCKGPGEFGSCPAWDYDVYLHLCEPADADAGAGEAGTDDGGDADAGPPEPVCSAELAHWITSYHREGRWVHDVSGVLPLLAGGGKKTLKLSIADPWVVSLDLRFSNQGKAVKPSESIALFQGQYTLDEQYNANWAPKTIPIPADAKKVEIATVLTGHGMSQPGNCAEFCNTDHHFKVNGTDNVRSFPKAGTSLGCMNQIEEGTVPNQYGTWWYGRGGWCPGKQVDMVMLDVTSQVTPGSDATFEYEGFYKGKVYTGGDNWRHIHLTSWLVISR